MATIDLATGNTSTVGVFGVDLVFPGLAYDPSSDQFLMTNSSVANRTTDLYRVDPDDATATLVGSTGIENISGLTYDSRRGMLYGVSGQTDSLYTVDPLTATATLIGNLGFESDVTGLAYDPNKDALYLNEITSDALYRIDMATGAATLIGFNGENYNVIGLAFDSDSNTLYGVGGLSDELMIIDTQSGFAQSVGFVGFDVMNNGLAFRTAAVPEPSTTCLFAMVCFGYLTIRKRTRVRSAQAGNLRRRIDHPPLTQ